MYYLTSTGGCSYLLLKSIFEKFNNVNSYAITFIIRDKVNNSLVNIGRHFLVNHESSPTLLLHELYKLIDIKSAKYNFFVDDKIIVKIRTLQFKIKNVNGVQILPNIKRIDSVKRRISKANFVNYLILEFYHILWILNFTVIWLHQ